MSRESLLRSLISIALIVVLAVAALPAFAQDGQWLTTSDVGTVGISAPGSGATVSGEVEIEGTATSGRFWYYKAEYSVDGSAWVSVTEDWQIETQVADGVLATWDTAEVANGAYMLRAVVVDNTGNYVASEPITVTVANEGAPEAAAPAEATPAAEEEAEVTATPAPAAPAAPAVPGWATTTDVGTAGISAPAAGATVSGEVDVEGTAMSARFWYYKVEYSVDGSAWVSVTEDYMNEVQVADDVLATWDTAEVANGAYMLRAVVVDNTGNYVASDAVTVTVANEGAPEAAAPAVATPEAEEEAEAEAEVTATPAPAAPAAPAVPGWATTTDVGTAGISAPAAGATVSGEVDIEGTATSARFWYYKVEYSVDGSAWVSVTEDWQTETQVTDDVLATWDTAAVANGAYMLRAVVVDSTGNYVASEPITVTVANAEAAE